MLGCPREEVDLVDRSCLDLLLPCPSIDPSDRIGCRSNLYIFTFLELIMLFKTPFCVFILIVN